MPQILQNERQKMKIHALTQGFTARLEKIAADKSISHRFGIFSMLCEDECRASNYLLAEDTLNTLEIAKNLGATVERKDDKVLIKAPKKIISPNKILDCGNSGTTMRLMMGFLAGAQGFFVLSGDKYLNKRPMKRISEPLKKMRARIYGREDASLAPLCIEGAKLQGIEYESKISSAQVKTAFILASLRANSSSHFSEPLLSRNHSENMLLAMDAPLKLSQDGLKIQISPLKAPLKPLKITIPNDPSSAFYFAVAAAILPNSRVILSNVLLNKTRIEAFKVLEKMGANIEFKQLRNDFEAVGEICVESSNLKAVTVSENISWLIDEAPALAIAFAFASGTSRLENAAELRVKESDRITAVVSNLQKCGILARELNSGFEVEGLATLSSKDLTEMKNSTAFTQKLTKDPKTLPKIQSLGDHRIAMSFAILGLRCGVEIDDTECINTSFPNFLSILKDLGARIED